MAVRKFILDNQEVSIPLSEIKNYYLYPECYFKNESELLPFPGRVYVSEDGDYCNGLDCSITVPSVLLDEQGVPLIYDKDHFSDEKGEGFIYEGKLYFTHELEEISF